MSPSVEHETVRNPDAGEGTRRAETRPAVGRAVSPGPPRPAWYENLPTWVAISIFVHGLVVLILIVLFASPGTFGLAGERDAGRLQGGATPTSIDARVSALERQAAALTAGASAQPTPQQPAPSAGTGVDLTPRLSALETRVAALCAAASPPC